MNEGDRVRQEKILGKIGISSDGFEPHLHFALTDRSDTSYDQGLPIIFGNVRPCLFPVPIDMEPRRLYLDGEFVEAVP